MTDFQNSGPGDGRYSPTTLTLLVVASMIGSGVYTTSGFALADLKSREIVLLAWLIAGAVAICGAIGYGQLVRRLTKNGGEYLYLSEYVHPAVGFLAGWVSFLAGFTSAAALAAMTFEQYAAALLPELELPEGSLAIAMILVVSGLHVSGARSGSVSQNAVVLLKLIALVAFLVWSVIGWERWDTGTAPFGTAGLFSSEHGLKSVGLGAFASSVMWISFSFTGFNTAIYVAEQSKSGARGVAKAMLQATCVVTCFYLLLNAVFLFSVPMDRIAGEAQIATIVAGSIGGATLEFLFRVVICIGLVSTVSSILMAGPRVYSRMAADGVFPRLFAAGDRYPRSAIALQSAAICIVALIGGLRELLGYLGLTLSICSAATVATVFLKRSADGGSGPPTVSYLGKLAAATYVFATIGLTIPAIMYQPLQAIALAITLAAGLAVWFLMQAAIRRKPQT